MLTEDGLYILLKPEKKQKGSVANHFDFSRVQSNLKRFIIAKFPEKGCQWSLSGPQFPKHTKSMFQQRYCYPIGNSNYSCRKGGALWSMVSYYV